jgi:hypothetical protein
LSISLHDFQGIADLFGNSGEKKMSGTHTRLRPQDSRQMHAKTTLVEYIVHIQRIQINDIAMDVLVVAPHEVVRVDQFEGPAALVPPQPRSP